MNRREALLSTSALFGSALALKAAEPEVKTCALAGTPLDDLHLYLCAFHVGKNDAKLQIEAHHYCMQLSDDLFQCIVIENNKPKARMLGIEYIVTDRIYQKLSDKEKTYWHPHEYEVTSGLLVAPKLAEEDENKLMTAVRKTWGKTWHTWPNPKDALPLGEPALMWAFDKDGQIDPQLILSRDRDLKIDTEAIKKRRAKL